MNVNVTGLWEGEEFTRRRAGNSADHQGPTVRAAPRRKAAQRKAAKANRLPMLYADKRALETNLKVSLLAIREKELNYYVSALAARLP